MSFFFSVFVLFTFLLDFDYMKTGSLKIRIVGFPEIRIFGNRISEIPENPKIRIPTGTLRTTKLPHELQNPAESNRPHMPKCTLNKGAPPIAADPGGFPDFRIF